MVTREMAAAETSSRITKLAMALLISELQAWRTCKYVGKGRIPPAASPYPRQPRQKSSLKNGHAYFSSLGPSKLPGPSDSWNVILLFIFLFSNLNYGRFTQDLQHMRDCRGLGGQCHTEAMQRMLLLRAPSAPQMMSHEREAAGLRKLAYPSTRPLHPSPERIRG